MVRARLFLGHSPLCPFPLTSFCKKAHEFRPLNARFYLDRSRFRIEVQNSPQFASIDQFGTRSELLATRGVASASDAYGAMFPASLAHDSRELLQGPRR